MPRSWRQRRQRDSFDTLMPLIVTAMFRGFDASVSRCRSVEVRWRGVETTRDTSYRPAPRGNKPMIRPQPPANINVANNTNLLHT